MASFSTMMGRCDRIRRASSIHELGVIIRDFPEVIFSKVMLAEVMKAIPKIIRTRNETYFDYTFIRAVIESHRERETGAFKTEYFKDMLETPGGFGSNDFALDLLRYYAVSLTAYTEGRCLEIGTVYRDYTPDATRMNAMDLMGWLFLVADWSENDPLTIGLMKYVIDGNLDQTAAFLENLADALCSMMDPTEAAGYLARLWRDQNHDPDDIAPKDIPFSKFISKCKDRDVGWLVDQIRHVKVDGNCPSERTVNNCADLFMILSNVFTNKFARENYFFEYIAEVCYYYPLINQRTDIADRYKRYFGDDAIMYMADFTNDVIINFSMLGDYKDTAMVRAAENPLHRKAESIIIKLHRDHPDVPARVIELFFKDTCRAFGRGFNGAAPGLLCKIEPMIYSIIEEDQKATESDLDCFSMLMALEGSYGDEPSVNNDREDSFDPGLHEKANVRKNPDTMKAAERKIYSGYRKYKDAEEKVDETLNRGIATLKRAVVGDQQAVIIEGKKFSAVGFLKKALATLAIFNYNKIAGILFIIVSQCMKKKTKRSEKRKILEELEAELVMVNEKIDDARGDGNREAKYDLMRTRNALQNAIKRIKYGMGAEEKEGLKDAERIKGTLAQARSASAASYRG